MMKRQPDTIPNITMVKEQKNYTTFIAQLTKECSEAVLRAIEMQCQASMVQGSLGFSILAKKDDGYYCLIISLPSVDDAASLVKPRADARHAANLVEKLMSRAFWGSAHEVHRFSTEEIESIAASTTHMTKCHIAVLGWELYAIAKEEYLERAAAMNKLQMDPKEALPMLRNVDDEVVSNAVKTGILTPVISRYLGIPQHQRLAVADGCRNAAPCNHSKTDVMDIPQYCRSCYGEISLSDGSCTGCGENAHIPPCAECGATPNGSNMMRHKCTECGMVLCNICKTQRIAMRSTEKKTSCWQ